jgi:hypothetical protein
MKIVTQGKNTALSILEHVSSMGYSAEELGTAIFHIIQIDSAIPSANGSNVDVPVCSYREPSADMKKGQFVINLGPFLVKKTWADEITIAVNGAVQSDDRPCKSTSSFLDIIDHVIAYLSVSHACSSDIVYEQAKHSHRAVVFDYDVYSLIFTVNASPTNRKKKNHYAALTISKKGQPSSFLLVCIPSPTFLLEPYSEIVVGDQSTPLNGYDANLGQLVLEPGFKFYLH